MGKADLHIHTSEGDGLDPIAAILDFVQNATDLDLIAITEHDDLSVALRAREVWSRRSYRFGLVTGLEVTTLEGHVLALYVETPVPSLRRVEETIAAVHAQGGICVVPHPLSWLTRSIGPGTFRRLARAHQPSFDAIELATAAPTSRRFLPKARRLNDESLRLPAVGASDAHFARAVGSAWTRFEGASALDLRRALAAGQVQGESGNYPNLRETGLLRTLALPLTGLRATPKQLGWRRTAWSFVSRYAFRPGPGQLPSSVHALRPGPGQLS